jgi:hypothetical protein
LKIIILSLFISFPFLVKAQKIESIYVHLYTDSLKKGTLNYINIDGKLLDGHYLPLDSTFLTFSASDGKFEGNSLWVDPLFSKDKVSIKVVLKANPAIYKNFDVYIKKNPDPELKTEKELLNELKKKSKNNRS